MARCPRDGAVLSDPGRPDLQAGSSAADSTSNLKTCPSCGLQVKPSAKKCPRDGTNLVLQAGSARQPQAPPSSQVYCVSCEQQFDPSVSHCPQCNIPLLATADSQPSFAALALGSDGSSEDENDVKLAAMSANAGIAASNIDGRLASVSNSADPNALSREATEAQLPAVTADTRPVTLHAGGPQSNSGVKPTLVDAIPRAAADSGAPLRTDAGIIANNSTTPPSSQQPGPSAARMQRSPVVAPTLLSHELPRMNPQAAQTANQEYTLITTGTTGVPFTGQSMPSIQAMAATKRIADTNPDELVRKNAVVQSDAEGRKTCPTCGLKVAPSVQICPRDGTNLNPVLNDPAFRGKFEFMESIGAGGMGVIYKARHLNLNRIVAIKMLHSHLHTQETIKRFQIEAKAASILSHPGIVAVHDVGATVSGQPYMVMDFIAGETLAEVLTREVQLNRDRFFKIFQQVCDALGHAHKRKVLHRDIKPSNIMLEQNDKVKIMDFGIAKIVGDAESGAQHLTKTGDAIGSPMYMSPEQAQGMKLDQRSDLYSLGCVMYECLTGTPPFQGSTALDTMLMHMNDKPLPMKQASMGAAVYQPLENIVMRLLEKNPDDRYQSMSELGADLNLLKEAGDKGVSIKFAPTVKAKVQTRRIDRATILKICAGIAVGILLIAAPAIFLFPRLKDSMDKKTIDKAFDLNNRENLQKVFSTGVKAVERVKTDDLSRFTNAADIDLRNYVDLRDAGERPISDNDLKPLAEAKVATRVAIHNANVTDKMFSYLQGLKNLTDLKLDNTHVSDLKGIETFAKLSRLDVRGTRLTHAGVNRISKLTNLGHLDLSVTPIDSTDLKQLENLRKLYKLELIGCSYLKPEDVRQFSSHFPPGQLKIVGP